MPSASDEVQAIIRATFGSLDDGPPLQFLLDRGYTEERGWISMPSPDHVIKDDEGDCITFMCDEWDYGFGGPDRDGLKAMDELLARVGYGSNAPVAVAVAAPTDGGTVDGARILAHIKAMTPEQGRQSLIDAGIYSEDGTLREPYATGNVAQRLAEDEAEAAVVRPAEELVMRCGLRLEDGWKYFVSMRGHVMRRRPGPQIRDENGNKLPIPELIIPCAVECEEGFFYFVDTNGHVSRRRQGTLTQYEWANLPKVPVRTYTRAEVLKVIAETMEGALSGSFSGHCTPHEIFKKIIKD